MAAREKVGREASPSAGEIDSRSVKTTESGGPRRYDAGKKIKGRKHHIVTDTAGHMVGLVVHEADVQDRDGAVLVLKEIRHLYPWLRHIFADGGYTGDKLRRAEQDRRLVARDPQAGRRRQGLRRRQTVMGRRADLRLARPPRFHRQRRSLDPRR